MTQENFVDPNVAAAQKLYDQGFFGSDMSQMPKPPDDETNKRIALQFKEDALNQRVNQMRQLQVPEEQIQTQLGSEAEKLEQEKRGILLTGDGAIEGSLVSDLPQQPEVVQQPDPRDQMMSIPAMAGYNLQQEALGMAGQAGAAKAAETAAAQRQIQTELERQRKANEEATQAEADQLQAKADELEAEVDRVSALRVDPGKFWSDRSTGQKIGLGISLALGAFGAARTGVNQAANVIDKAIKTDIDAQVKNIAQQGQGVTNQRGLFAQMKSKFNSDRLAREAAIVAYLNDSQLKIKEIASKYDSQIVQANAANMIGQLEAKKDVAKAKIMQDFQKQIQIGPDVDLQKLSATNPDLAARYVKGYGLVATKDMKKRADNIIVETTNITENLADLIDIAKAGGSSIPLSEAKSKAVVIAGMLKGQLIKPLVGAGAVSDAERKMINDIVADPSAFFSSSRSNINKLSTLSKKLRKAEQNMLSQMGLSTAQDQQDKLGFKPLK